MNDLERLIRKAAKVLRDHQVCRLYKFPNDLRMLKGLEIAFGEKVPVDFMGFTASGRVIMIEAKQVKRASLPIAIEPGLKPHQWEALCECHRANGIALICWQRGKEVATVDVEMAAILSGGRASIPWKEISKPFIHPVADPLKILEPYVSVATIRKQ